MKNFKWPDIIISICYILGGIFFFADPNITKELICSWIGYGLLITGAIFIIAYFFRPKYEGFIRNEFMIGLIVITIGILPLIKGNIFIELVYSALAIVIMISGYKKLQDCVDAWRLGYKFELLYLVLASISIVIGVVIIVVNISTIKALHNLIGVGLLYSGLSDLFSTIFLSSKMNSYVNNLQENKQVIDNEEPKE